MTESNASPKYRTVFEELRREILTGKFRTGDKLPSEADLVKRFGASRITVGRAVRDLREHGLVQRRAGSGTYVQAPPAPGTEGSFTFALLIPDLGRSEIFEPICQGMADSPDAGPHSLLWSSATSRDDGRSRQEQALELCHQHIARNVSGVFFAPLESLGPEDRTNFHIIVALEKARIPVILLDRDLLPYPRRSAHDLVGIDNRRTGFAATDHLLTLGCQRVVFLSFPRTPSTVAERIAGYREALYFRELPVRPSDIQVLVSDDAGQVRAIMETSQADGFVCANDRTAGKLMHALLALGYQIPGNIRVVGIDDVNYASLLPVPLTTMHQPCREIGMAAMSAMLERIKRPQMPVRDILLECPLVIRRSCGANAANTDAISRPSQTE